MKLKKKGNKDGNIRYEPHDLTSDILIKTTSRQILKAKQPLPYLCHNRLSITVYHFTLCVRTISKTSHYIFVLHLHQTTNLFMELFLVNIMCIAQLFHGDRRILEYSLQWQDASHQYEFLDQL